MRKKLLAILGVALLSAMLAVPAYATTYNGTINGTKTATLETYFAVDSDASIPAQTFTYSIAAGQASTATSSIEVTPGPDGAKVTSSVAFAAGETATAALANAADQTGKIAAMKTLTADFSGVTFPKPGVYRYVVTEAGFASPISAVVDKITIDVYVENDTVEGELKIANYITYKGDVEDDDPSTLTSNDKSDKFVNVLTTYDLAVVKKISGSQADLSATFDFDITINGLVEGTIINVDTDTTGNAPTSYTANSSGTVAITDFALGNNDELKLTGIPAGATYTVTEDESGQDGYTTTGEVSTAATLNADATVTVTNTKDGTIPTGVLTMALPGVALIVLALLVFALRRSPARK